jgi:MYXO-CTERM domain-containing protein
MNAAVDLGAFESGPAVPVDAPAMDATVDVPTRVDVARSDVVDVPRVDSAAMLDVTRTNDAQSANDARAMDAQSVRDAQVVDASAIDAAADVGFDAGYEAPEDVRVPEDVAAVVDTGDGGSDDVPMAASDEGTSEVPPAEGCGCTASGSHAKGFWGLVVLAWAIARRRSSIARSPHTVRFTDLHSR